MGALYPHLIAVKGFQLTLVAFRRTPRVSVPRLTLTLPSDVPFLHI